ncbi:protease inhibitor [Allosaccharopolyspora coralli]|uniref:Protease inhibitor n=1 Tax=Allosaccharopolyspora coralli TaxID=2665642 RepID=A0A5Q3QBJ1_9PSEU|nr:SSI family serine proteinase inhibitor [Allosaccharopolyspora coralli]QGK71230.1 protease inhibitor [Allosaccharopolyspora coralli]
MSAHRSIGGTVLAAAAVVGAALIPATAHAGPAEPAELSVMHLSVTNQAKITESRSTLLTCGPAGGTHANAAQACAALDEAAGNFQDLQAQSTQCPLIYEPVTVTAKGTWKNAPVEFTHEFANSCVLAAQTEGVYDF